MEELLGTAERRADRRAFSRVGWALSLFLLLQIGGQYLLLAPFRALAPGLLEAPWFGWALSAAASYLLAFPAAVLALRSLPAAEAPAPAPLKGRAFFELYLVAMAVIYSANIVTLAIIGVINGIRGMPMTNPLDLMQNQSAVLNLLLGCVLAPLAEEYLFRGVLLERLKTYGEGFAVFASALLFSMVHGNLFQMLYAFSVGLLLGYVALKTGGIRWTVPLHAGVNFISAGLAPLLELLGRTGDVLLSLLILFSIGFGWYLLVSRWHDIKVRPGPEEPGMGEKWGLFLVNPGMTLFSVLTLFSILALMRM